jgi:DNA-binding CsgD family transcriptional regulator
LLLLPSVCVTPASPQKTRSREVFLQRPKRNTQINSVAEPQILQAGAFAFCDRASGAIRFQVRAAADGELPVEEAASLLAMHCLVRAQKPEQYVVLVVPSQELLAPVGGRAEQLLTASRTAAGSGVKLSVRQREVLDHVLQDLSNKEIGTRLNVTERTVKFHVSRLLSKFKARDRAGLKQEAALGMLSTSAVPENTLFGFPIPPELVARTDGASDRAAKNGNNGHTTRAASLLDFRPARREETRGAARH